MSVDSRRLLTVTGLTKSFGPTRALDGVDVTLDAGEVLAVVGHNGSGKSTLVKLLANFHVPDAGTIELGSNRSVPTQLRFIHQDLGLVGSLSTVENLSLGVGGAGRPWRRIRRQAEREEARRLVAEFALDVDVDVPVEDLSPAERTVVAIARALRGWDADADTNVVLVLDEPTASLHGAEVDRLMEVVQRIAERGAAVLFISHRLDEVLGIADTVLALRNGRVVGHLPREQATYVDLVELVAGEAVDEVAGRQGGDIGEAVLEVRGLSGGAIRELDLTVQAGEVVGIAGILGSGRDELCSLVFGARTRAGGAVAVRGKQLVADVRDAIRHGCAFVPGDRHRHGAVMTMSASENLSSVRVPGAEPRFARIRNDDEARDADEWFRSCGVVPARPEMPLSQFSGGNQQKVVLAKWLRTRPAVLLLEEPTQGVDIGARARIHELVLETAAQGTAVVVASSEAKELAALCDRVLVLDGGVVAQQLPGESLSEARILQASVPT